MNSVVVRSPFRVPCLIPARAIRGIGSMGCSPVSSRTGCSSSRFLVPRSVVKTLGRVMFGHGLVRIPHRAGRAPVSGFMAEWVVVGSVSVDRCCGGFVRASGSSVTGCGGRLRLVGGVGTSYHTCVGDGGRIVGSSLGVGLGRCKFRFLGSGIRLVGGLRRLVGGRLDCAIKREHVILLRLLHCYGLTGGTGSCVITLGLTAEHSRLDLSSCGGCVRECCDCNIRGYILRNCTCRFGCRVNSLIVGF